MSPEDMQAAKESWRFPRVSGDEPTSEGSERTYPRFSPRERG